MNRAILLAILVLLAWSSLVSAADHSAVVKERQALMKANGQAQKAMKHAVTAGDLVTVEKEANMLANNFDKLADPSLFPTGNASKESRARALVWENRERFVQQAKDSATIARAIAAEAKAGQLQQAKHP